MKDSLNELRLTAEMIASLYGHSLVSPADHTVVKTKVENDHVAIKYLGNNAKNITVLVNNPGHAFMPEQELTFLTRMLEACRLNMGDIAIVNVGVFNHPLSQIVDRLSPSLILSFGARAGKNLFSQEREQNVDILDAPPLADMLQETIDSRQLKSRLWIALKQIFNL